MLHVYVVLSMRNMNFPSGLTFTSMHDVYTSLTIPSLFEVHKRIAMLRPSGLCLVWIRIYLVLTYHCMMWTCILHPNF